MENIGCLQKLSDLAWVLYIFPDSAAQREFPVPVNAKYFIAIGSPIRYVSCK